MEPLLEQPDHFNVTRRVNLDHSSISPSIQVIHSVSHPNNILIESQNSLQNNDLQDSTSFLTTPSSSSSSHNDTLASLQIRGHLNNGRSPPPLTSQDIAALRKTLSGRPKLRRVCQICGRECPSRHKLQRHLSTHSEERPYNCKVCGKAFKWTEYLSKHMRTQHGPGSSNVVKPHITIRNTGGSTGSISSNEDLAVTGPTTPIASNPPHSTLRSSSVTPEAVVISQNKTQVTSGTNSTSTGYVANSTVNQNQSSPDVFSPQPAYDQILLTESANSSTPLLSSQSAPVMSNQLTPTYSAGYFPTGFSYPPLFPMNCYGYPHPPTHMDVMGQYPMPPPPNGFNNMYQPPPGSFDPNYQNYNMRPQPQELDKGHSNLVSSSSIVTTTSGDLTSSSTTRDTTITSSSSSSVSCQTQESQDLDGASNTANNKSKPPVVIINLCTKKDVGIQCEVGDETLQALYEEEDQLNSAISVNGFDSNSSITSDEGLSCVCKYPCEYEGCVRSYVHRKDLIRHMKSAHSTVPRLLQPKVIETPAKPYICQVSDCGKSYYHLKDLRRHQRQCHLVGLSVLDSNGTTNAHLEAVLDDASSLRYPCDFKGCSKSYIHKKDLIRHKRSYHQDNSSHPSIPEPVIVIHVKKGGKDKNIDEEDEEEGRRLPVKRFRLDSSSEPLNIAQLPISNQQPTTNSEGQGSGDLTSLNASNIMDNISAIFDMERSPLNNIFPVESLTAATTSSSTNLAVSVTSTSTDDDAGNTQNNMYATPTSSPSALFMTLLSQNI